MIASLYPMEESKTNAEDGFVEKEPWEYCDEKPTPIMERQGLKVSLDEDGDIFVSLSFGGSGSPARAYATVNYCPMCGRKLEDV